MTNKREQINQKAHRVLGEKTKELKSIANEAKEGLERLQSSAQCLRDTQRLIRSMIPSYNKSENIIDCQDRFSKQ